MPGIDWDLKFRAETAQLSELERKLKDIGLTAEQVKKKAAEGRQYDALVRDLKKLGIEIDGVTKKEEKLAEAEHKEAKAAKEAKGEHDKFFGKMLEAEVIGEQINRVIDKVEDLGMEFVKSSVEAVDFDYKATAALTHMTGSAEAAEDIMQSARAFATGVGEDLDKTVNTFQRLAATGLRGDNLTAAADAAKDLSVVTGQSFDSVAGLFEMIGSDKGLGGRAVNRLQEYPQLLNELEKHFGFVPGTAKSFQQLSKHLEEAPVKGAQGLQLLESMVMKVAHEGQLGDVGVEIGDSFSGAANKFETDWKSALGTISQDPALGLIRSDLSDLADYFDPASAGGQELADSLKGISEPAHELFGFLKENRGAIADALSAGIESAKFTLEVIEKTIEAIVTGVKDFQRAAQIAGAFFETGSLSKTREIMQDYDDEQATKAAASDEEDRQRRMSPAERKADAELQRSTQDAISHPRELPELAPLPAAASGGSVMSTGLVTVHEGEEIVPAGISQGGSSSSSVTNGGHEFHFNVTVQGGGDGQHMDEQLLAAKLTEMAPSALMSALEQMNQMRGGR